MSDRYRPQNEDAIVFAVDLRSNVEVTKLIGNGLALLRHLLSDNHHPNMGFEQSWFAHVTNTADEVECAIAHGNDGIFAKNYGNSAFPGHREFGKYNSCHASLYDHANDTLSGHHYNRKGTLFIGSPEIIVKETKNLILYYYYRQKIRQPDHWPLKVKPRKKPSAKVTYT